MATLQEDILACLDDLAGSGASHGSGGGGEGGDYPRAWLLLDLQQLLPANSDLAIKLRANEGQLCRELEAADRDERQAHRMASRLLEGIAADSYSTRQLAELVFKNRAMLALCLGGLSAKPAGLEAAGIALGMAAWRVLSRQAAQLPALGDGPPAAQAAAGVVGALETATWLTFGSTDRAAMTVTVHALAEHGSSLLTVLRFGAAAAAESRSLGAAQKGTLSYLLARWAEQAPLAVSRASWNTCLDMLEPSLAIAGECACVWLREWWNVHLCGQQAAGNTFQAWPDVCPAPPGPSHTTTCCAALCCLALPRSLLAPPPADLYLDVTLRRLLQSAPNYRDLRPEGPADKLTAVVLAVSSCTHQSVAWTVRNAAKALLRKHAAAMLQLACQHLQQPPEEQLTAAAAAAAAGTASSKAAGAWAQAAAGLAKLVNALLCGMSAIAADMPASAALQSSPAAAQSIRAFEAALYAVLDGRAACLAWLPASERQRVQRMCNDAARDFESLLAAAWPPAPPPPQLLPRPQPPPAAGLTGSSGSSGSSSQQAGSGDGGRASYAAAAASGAGRRPPPGLAPAGPEPAPLAAVGGGEGAEKPTYAAMARGGRAATERPHRSAATSPQAERQKGILSRVVDLCRNFLSID